MRNDFIFVLAIIVLVYLVLFLTGCATARCDLAWRTWCEEVQRP